MPPMEVTQIGKDENGAPVFRAVETSAANTALSANLSLGAPAKILHAQATYNAPPTQAGVAVILDSGAGANYDSTLMAGTANSRYNNYTPEGGELQLGADDGLRITAPAGGAGIVCAVSITLKQTKHV